ncbi:class I SAM-dependent methyltransferase [Candidatus Parcubacteria bacterium]|nr:MAG: class I SAM-dependent methyltransferase [Candidatus Parcubacteria bacterium]
MAEALRPEVKYFNDKSVEYRKEYDRVTAEGYSFRVRREKVLDMVPENTKVVDIASGPGVMIPGLRAKNCHITCTDAAPEMIARTKEEYGEAPDIEAVVGDAYSLPFEDNAFDVAIAMGLIEYLEDQARYLNETHRILRQGGIAIITFPNRPAPFRFIGRVLLKIARLFGKKPTPGNVTHREYTAKGAKRLMEAHGFTVTETVYYNFKLIPYPFDLWLPHLTVIQSRIFEYLDRTPLKWFGTGFILKATKR